MGPPAPAQLGALCHARTRTQITPPAQPQNGTDMNMQSNGLLGVLILAADVWAIINIFQSGASNGNKAFWIVLVALLPVLGMILWFFLGPRGGRMTGGA